MNASTLSSSNQEQPNSNAKAPFGKLIVSILLPVIVGFAASFFTRPEIQGWYQTIEKPWFRPPNWLFAPVWTSLYLMMGIALFLIWRKLVFTPSQSVIKQRALWSFAVQLFFNFWWSVIFFRFHAIGGAFLWILILWILILINIFQFAKLNKTAAWLLVPYIAWVSFASILNGAIWYLN